MKFLKMGILVGMVSFLIACAPKVTAPQMAATPGGMGVTTPSIIPEIQETTPVIAAESPPETPDSQGADLTQGLAESSVLTIWHGFQDEGLFLLRAILDEFQAQAPDFRFELVYVPYDDLYDRYIKAIDTGKGPDLLFGAGEWGPGFYELGVIPDSANLISPTLRSRLNPAALAAVAYQQALTGLPYELRGVVMYRNNAIMTSAPVTFQELVTRARGLTGSGVIGAYLERGDLYAPPQLAACGGKLYSEQGFPYFNSLPGQCWIQLLRAFETAGPVSFNSNDDLERFMDGNVGIIFDGTWNLAKLSEALGDRLEIDPWPAHGEGHLSGYVWTENIYTNPGLDQADIQAVRALFEFMLSAKAQGRIASQGRIPAIASLDTEEGCIPQVMGALSLGTPYPALPEIKFYWEPLHQALVSIFEQDGDVSAALRQASDEITEAIREDRNMRDELLENSKLGTES